MVYGSLWWNFIFMDFDFGNSLNIGIFLSDNDNCLFGSKRIGMEQSWLVVRTEISKQEDFNRISLCIDHINTIWPCRKARSVGYFVQCLAQSWFLGRKWKRVPMMWLRPNRLTFTCFVLGERLCPRESESSEFVSCCVLGASVVSCTEVSKATTSFLRPGFRIDFW